MTRFKASKKRLTLAGAPTQDACWGSYLLGTCVLHRAFCNTFRGEWAVGSRVSADEFTDAVNSRVSFPDADRLMGGVGAVVEAARAWDGGALSLRGSVNFERMFDGAATIRQHQPHQVHLGQVSVAQTPAASIPEDEGYAS